MTESNVSTLPTKAPEDDESVPLTAEDTSAGTGAPTTREEAVKRAYSAATTALREAHREEFHADVQARVREFGFDWSPKPTKQEKAVAEARRLLAEAGLSKADL